MKRHKKWLRILLIIICIIIVILTPAAGRMIYLMSATKGEAIEDYDNDKAALVVIDLQEDTLSVPQYHNSKELMQNVNASIAYAEENGIDIIYIKQEYSNFLDLILSGGKYKSGSTGAALSSQLLVKSDQIFTKLRSDSFSQKAFEQYLIENQINTLYIVGADATACVFKTSLGGVNRGYQVNILKDCIFSLSDSTLKQMLKEYEKAGINLITMKDFIK